jgi:localization factor PodJL
VVDRLAMIEGDLRSVRVAPAALQSETPPAPQPGPPQPAAPLAAIAPQPKPELPNPAAAQGHFAAAPREFQAVQAPVPAIAAATPRAISEILESHAAPPQAAIVPELPPDHPLEPGTRPSGRVPSPSERIAASDASSDITASARGDQHTNSLPPRAGRAWPPRQRRVEARPPAARSRMPPATRPRKHRRPAPRFARCWSARAWS